MNDLYLTLDKNFLVKSCNQSAMEYLGKKDTEILNKPFWDFFKSSISPTEVIAELNSNAAWSFAYNYSLNRQKYTFFISIGAIQSQKNTEYVVHAYRRKSDDLAFEKVKENLLGFQQMFEDFPGYYWGIINLNDTEFAFFPASIKKATGYSPQEIENLPGKLLFLVDKEDAAMVIKEFNSLTTNYKKNTLDLDYRIVKKDKQVRWVRENISVQRDNSGKIISKFGIAIDITNLKEAESGLLRSESELKSINGAKDRFINILSHDLRAPFTSILGFSEILIHEPNLPLNEKNEYLNYIYEASQSQLQFIGYLLDWSRLNTGSLKIEPQRLKAQSIIYQCISSLTGNAIRKNVDIQVDVAEEIYIQADERLVTQVVINLLSNAIKFSNENSVIEISASVFNESQVEFIVKDSGVGIKNDDQSKVFSIDKSFTREGTKGEKGSGFGLALVREIVQKHSGEIWYYSEEGKGTEFHFTLPLPSNTILVVENNQVHRTAYLELLKKSFGNFVFLQAENGYEAMNIISDSFPNLIITNHEMPLMNGLQLIESLKRGDNSLKYPVIIIGDEISSEVKKLYNQLGAKAVIDKPFNDDELTKVVSYALS